jgi:S1-C subfamily serine protease
MPDDIITSINGIKINNIKQVVKIVASLEVNQTVILIYKRNKELIESSIKVTAMPRTHKTINR